MGGGGGWECVCECARARDCVCAIVCVRVCVRVWGIEGPTGSNVRPDCSKRTHSIVREHIL